MKLVLREKVEPDSYIRRTAFKTHFLLLRKLKDFLCTLWSEQ